MVSVSFLAGCDVSPFSPSGRIRSEVLNSERVDGNGREWNGFRVTV